MKTVIFTILLAGSVSACITRVDKKELVIATNGWTAAYAIAAGAKEVEVLAPYEMVHPSEYELRPGDIGRLSNAKLIVYAGYEVMVDQLKTGLNIPGDKLLMITTSYNFEEIEKSVMLIANSLGTEQAALKNLVEIRVLLEKGRVDILNNGKKLQPALVHFFQESFVKELGIEPLAVFGPAPPEPKSILEMTKTNATQIIDNAHNPAGGSLKETLPEAEYELLLNFPGMHNTRTLSDVIRYNISQLTD